MGCGCGGGKKKNKTGPRLRTAQNNTQQTTNNSSNQRRMVNLPSPSNSGETAKQRIKRLNREAINRMRGL